MKLEVRIEPTSYIFFILSGVLEAFHSKAQTLLSLYFLMDHDILVHDIPVCCRPINQLCINSKLLFKIGYISRLYPFNSPQGSDPFHYNVQKEQMFLYYQKIELPLFFS